MHARNHDGETALHVIARRDTASFVYTRDGKEAVEINRKLFEFIVAKGLDPLKEDARGRSSLDIAAAYKKKEILDLFQY